MKKLIARLLTAAFPLLLSGLPPSPVHAADIAKPFNRIASLIDTSGSYKDSQAAAIAKTQSLLDDIDNRHHKRGEVPDEIVLIALDAIPEVVWRGTRKQLGAESAKSWKERFDARKDYAGCTDVEAGLALAAAQLNDAPAAQEKYLFAFSDFKHEPPRDDGKGCKAPQTPSVPGKDFDWLAFKDVSVAVFWMPYAQKAAWAKQVKEAGLADSFKLYVQAESQVVKISAPPAAKRKVSVEELGQARERIAGGLWTIISAVAAVLAVALFFSVALWSWARLRRAPAPAPGTFAPMRKLPTRQP